jgi:hypothetical protein
MADGHLEGRSTKPGDWAAYRVTSSSSGPPGLPPAAYSRHPIATTGQRRWLVQSATLQTFSVLPVRQAPTSCSWAPEASPSPLAFAGFWTPLWCCAARDLRTRPHGRRGPSHRTLFGAIHPGPHPSPPTKPTWPALVHAVIRGPIAFLAIFGACLTIASHLEGAWRLYSCSQQLPASR